MTAGLIAWLARLISGANVRWVGCRPEMRRRVYFANHTSHLDAVVLWAALPPVLRPTARPVAAQDYWMATSLRRHLAEKAFHAVLIPRRRVTAANNPLELLLAALDNGHSLILFPEGTRSASGELKPFKSGLYHLSRKRPEVELIPVHIDNLNRVLPKGEVLAVPLLSCISFGAPMRVEPGESKPVFLARAQAAVEELKQTSLTADHT